MMALRPRARAEAAYSNNRSGVRCAETTRTSCAIPSESRVSAAPCIVSQSDVDPMMIPTRAFMIRLVYQALSEQLPQKCEKFPGAGRASAARCVRARAFSSSFVRAARSACGYSCSNSSTAPVAGPRAGGRASARSAGRTEFPDRDAACARRVSSSTGSGSMLRINLPMYWRCLTCAPCEGRRRRSRSATNRLSGRSRALISWSGSADSFTPSSCKDAASRLRALLLRRCSARFRPNRLLQSRSSYCPMLPLGPVESPGSNLEDSVGDDNGRRARQPATSCRKRPRIDHRACARRGAARGALLRRKPPSARILVFRSACDSGEVETLEHQRDRSMGITVYFGQRKGSASTADFSLDAVRATVAKACSIARFTAEDACAGLADAALMARSPPDLDLCPSLEHVRGPRHRDCQIVRGSSDGVRSADQQLRGLLREHPSRACTSMAILTASSAAIRRPRTPELRRARRKRGGHAARLLVQQLAGLAGSARRRRRIGRESARRTIARLGPRKLSTRRAPVLFNPEMARGLIGHFTGAIRGSSQYRQSSFLLNSAGQRVFPAGFSIGERPHILKAMGSAPFDEEGVATRERELIADGVLTGYILSSYSARKLGLKTTGNAGGAHNLVVAATIPRAASSACWRARQRALRDRTDGARRECGDRRLFARRGRLLGGKRRDPISGGRDHDRGQSRADVQTHRGGRRRCGPARQASGSDRCCSRR